jgi:hypothetical protein
MGKQKRKTRNHMTKNIYRIAGLAVTAGAAMALTACVGISSESKKAEQPEIAAGKKTTQGSLTNVPLALSASSLNEKSGGPTTNQGNFCSMVQSCVREIRIFGQPGNQVLFTNTEATFSVDAAAGPPYSTSGLTYQWQVNKYLLVSTNADANWTNCTCPGATTSSIEITNVQLSDVGYYRVLVSAPGSTTVTSAAPYLQVVIPGSITVNGTPIAGIVSNKYCGSTIFAGYIPYTNDPPHGLWGWAVIDTNQDISGADAVPTAGSYVACIGYNGDVKCSAQIVTKTHPITAQHGCSPRYEFKIFFPAPVPTGPYPLTLTNFQ